MCLSIPLSIYSSVISVHWTVCSSVSLSNHLYLSLCPSIYICLSVHPSISVYPSISPSVCLSDRTSVHPSCYLFFCPSINLSVRPSVFQSGLSVYTFTHLPQTDRCVDSLWYERVTSDMLFILYRPRFKTAPNFSAKIRRASTPTRSSATSSGSWRRGRRRNKTTSAGGSWR